MLLPAPGRHDRSRGRGPHTGGCPGARFDPTGPLAGRGRGFRAAPPDHLPASAPCRHVPASASPPATGPGSGGRADAFPDGGLGPGPLPGPADSGGSPIRFRAKATIRKRHRVAVAPIPGKAPTLRTPVVHARPAKRVEWRGHACRSSKTGRSRPDHSPSVLPAETGMPRRPAQARVRPEHRSRLQEARRAHKPAARREKSRRPCHCSTPDRGPVAAHRETRRQATGSADPQANRRGRRAAADARRPAFHLSRRSTSVSGIRPLCPRRAPGGTPSRPREESRRRIGPAATVAEDAGRERSTTPSTDTWPEFRRAARSPRRRRVRAFRGASRIGGGNARARPCRQCRRTTPCKGGRADQTGALPARFRRIIGPRVADGHRFAALGADPTTPMPQLHPPADDEPCGRQARFLARIPRWTAPRRTAPGCPDWNRSSNGTCRCHTALAGAGPVPVGLRAPEQLRPQAGQRTVRYRPASSCGARHGARCGVRVGKPEPADALAAAPPSPEQGLDGVTASCCPVPRYPAGPSKERANPGRR